MKYQTIQLVEYKHIFIGDKDLDGNKALCKQVFSELEEFVLKNDTYQYLKLSHKKGYGKVLQAQNFVGVIQTKNGTTIEILPKIANLTDNGQTKKILIKMLKTLKDSPFKNINTANLKSEKLPILEIFISMFLEELSSLIRKGIKNDYISKQENLYYLKGKLKTNEQIKQNYIHKERFFVEYEEYISDRVENRLIKTTLQYLYKKAHSNLNQQRIREFLFVFDNIGISHNIIVDFEKIKINRQMLDYKQTLQWCNTFLLENSFSPYKGNDVAFALLFDMNILFESYVGHYLKGKGLNIKLQDKRHHLAYLEDRGKFQLKPDIVIDNGKIIADTKWKLLSEDKTHQGVSQADMYQLYAYGKKYNNCKNLFLIYPKNENSYKLTKCLYEFEQYSNVLNLRIIFFDLLNPEINFNEKEI